MTANIQEVDVTITIQSQAIQQEGFGVALVVGLNKIWTERARAYTSVAEMVTDGFISTDPEYVAASKYFAQSPAPEQIIIGRRTVDEVKYEVTTVADSTNYTTTVNGVDFTFNSGAGATAESIAIGLVAAINAGSEPVTATTGVAGTYALMADVAGTAYTADVDAGQTLTFNTPTDDISDDLDAILSYNNTWYAVIELLHDETEVAELAAWAETNKKLYLTSSEDSDIISVTDAADTTSIAAVLKAASYSYSTGMYHADADTEFPECAWTGACLPTNPGTITWAYKTLAGITYSALTDTERQNALDKFANIYVRRYGRDITQFGTVANSIYGYIDVRRTIDWLEARIAEAVFALLASSPKVPYTDPGIALVQNTVSGVLSAAVSEGALAASPAPVVTVPKASEVSAIDRAARLLPDVDFTAQLSSAIHNIKINGFVRV